MSSLKTPMVVVGYVVLLTVGLASRFPSSSFGRQIGSFAFMRVLRQPRPNAADARDQRRGYYEHLAAGANPTASWTAPPPEYRACVDPPLDSPASMLERVTTDWRNYRGRPSLNTTCFTDIAWRTNRYGFRDVEWKDQPEPGVVRIAIVGASYEVGFGVAEQDAYPRLLERLLNEKAAPGVRYEIINTSVTGYTPLDTAAAIDQVLSFSPRLIIVPAHADVNLILRRLTSKRERFGTPDAKVALMPEPLRGLVEEGKRASPAGQRQAARAIKNRSYKMICGAGAERGVPVVWALIPPVDFVDPLGVVSAPALAAGYDDERASAAAAGCLTIDGRDVYAGHDLDETWVHDYDSHPSVLAHQLIANMLYERLGKIVLPGDVTLLTLRGGQ